MSFEKTSQTEVSYFNDIGSIQGLLNDLILLMYWTLKNTKLHGGHRSGARLPHGGFRLESKIEETLKTSNHNWLRLN
jgi:hypothetical protein